MTDIVDRLKLSSDIACRDAADEIERLRQEREVEKPYRTYEYWKDRAELAEAALAGWKLFADELISFDPANEQEIQAAAQNIAKRFHEMKAALATANKMLREVGACAVNIENGEAMLVMEQEFIAKCRALAEKERE